MSDRKLNDEGATSGHAVLLFDGVCNLCNGFVQFIIKRDPDSYFQFASLQSETGKELLSRFEIPTDSIDTVVMIEEDQAYTRSDAALKVLRRLGRLWSLFYVFIIVPRSIRNAIYDWIAQNRYTWFGKKDSCMIPTPDLKDRFLD